MMAAENPGPDPSDVHPGRFAHWVLNGVLIGCATVFAVVDVMRDDDDLTGSTSGSLAAVDPVPRVEAGPETEPRFDALASRLAGGAWVGSLEGGAATVRFHGAAPHVQATLEFRLFGRTRFHEDLLVRFDPPAGILLVGKTFRRPMPVEPFLPRPADDLRLALSEDGATLRGTIADRTKGEAVSIVLSRAGAADLLDPALDTAVAIRSLTGGRWEGEIDGKRVSATFRTTRDGLAVRLTGDGRTRGLRASLAPDGAVRLEAETGRAAVDGAAEMLVGRVFDRGVESLGGRFERRVLRGPVETSTSGAWMLRRADVPTDRASGGVPGRGTR